MAGTAKPIKIDIIKNECGLRLNEELLKNELNNSEIEEALSNNKESDIYEIAARYNSRYFFDDIWVTATSNEGHKGEFNAHELLRLLFYSPDQYEDECLDVTTQSEFIFIQASVAGGQGGGLAIKNIRNNEWVFTTNEFSVQAILYVPKKKLFIGYTNVTTYAWATMYLSLITLKGDVTTGLPPLGGPPLKLEFGAV